MNKIPSAKDLVEEALQKVGCADVNSLHQKTFELMCYYRTRYYAEKVDRFLSELRLPNAVKKKLKTEMLKPVRVEDITYSNFMEETSRRVSQVFQVVSGNIAELCAQRELEKNGLREGVNFVKRKERTDFMIYFPDAASPKARHRVEVKNVKLRERGARGLVFDGDSLFGFFDDANEFTQSTVSLIDEHCKKTRGFCYLPPTTLNKLKFKSARFRPNTRFGKDMADFAKKGIAYGNGVVHGNVLPEVWTGSHVPPAQVLGVHINRRNGTAGIRVNQGKHYGNRFVHDKTYRRRVSQIN